VDLFQRHRRKKDNSLTDSHPTLSRQQIADYEQRAEAAYAAMYEAADHNQKDLKDDALFYLARATEIAEGLGLKEDVERLTKRAANITGVYNGQFRYIGR